MQDDLGVSVPSPTQTALDEAIAQHTTAGYRLLSHGPTRAVLQRTTRTARYAMLPAIGVIAVLGAVRLSSSLWPSTTSDAGVAVRAAILLATCAAYMLWLVLRRVADRVDLQLDLMGHVLIRESAVHALHPRRYAVAATLSGLGTAIFAIGLAGVLLVANRSQGVHLCAGTHFVGTGSICFLDDSSIGLGEIGSARMTIRPSSGTIRPDQTVMLTVDAPGGITKVAQFHVATPARWMYVRLDRVMTMAGVTAEPGPYHIAVRITASGMDDLIGSVALMFTP